jgi:glycosyltransferase involved in cell wall biosynthesis
MSKQVLTIRLQSFEKGIFMKVALISRSSMYSLPGGDTMQVMKTAKELIKIGVKVEVFRACESIPYHKFDLLHFFNIIRPADHLYHIRKSGKPYVLSTIFVDYREFDRNRKNKIHKNLLTLIGHSNAEYLKNLYRFAKKQDRLVSLEYVLGHRRAIQRILKNASIILPNSHSEYRRLLDYYKYSGNYQVVPNGVDTGLFGALPKNVVRQEKVLCVAQIYGLKNQLSLINVCKKLKLPLELIGSPTPNHMEYFELCKSANGGLVKFTDFIPQTELVLKYAGAKVHAMPSWFETTGLSSLEAGAMGCNILVGSGGDTKDYFKEDSWFCLANDEKSIENALVQAMNTPNTNKLRETILAEYTWAKAAEVTKKAYELVLEKTVITRTRKL